ncbi:histidinol-phosphate transaminase [Chloroflexota bacterium]
MERFIRRDIIHMEGYSPINPLEVLSDIAGIPAESLIKLDGNENPYSCSPRVRQVLADYPYYHIYPDPEQQELRRMLAGYTGVSANSIVAGAGSDELIDLVLRLFIEPGDKVINCVPTFGIYAFSTGVCGGQVVNVPRDESFAVDIDGVKAAIDERTKVIFVASPNNPSGNITAEEDILELLGTGVVVVIDEAYHEFSGVTAAPLIEEHNNLIILRTFSKWAGLAGLRVGYGFFPPQIAAYLMKIKPPYNVNSAAQIAVRESLEDIDYLRGTVEAIIAERERLFARLEGTGFLKPLPSRANFLLCSAPRGQARKIHRELQQIGIFIRYFDTPVLKDFLRISVGKPEHTDALVEALEEIC